MSDPHPDTHRVLMIAYEGLWDRLCDLGGQPPFSPRELRRHLDAAFHVVASLEALERAMREIDPETTDRFLRREWLG